MRRSRTITWARLRVAFVALLIALFAMGGFLVCASYFAEPQGGHDRWKLRALGVEVMALSVIAGACGAVLKKFLSESE